MPSSCSSCVYRVVCTLMFASAEISGDGVVLKDMKKGSQAIIKHSNIVEEVSNLLSSL